MKIAIVIPSYNAQKYLALTLDSVLAQSFSDWELVIIDDGSQDSTCEIAAAYAARDQRIRVTHQRNGGVAVARQQGFALTSPQAEAIIFLDNDDLWDPEMLATVAAVLEEHPEAAGAYVLARFIDGEGRPSQPGVLEDRMRTRRRIEGNRAVTCLPQDLTTFACFALEQQMPTPGVLLMRRALLEAIGGFDPAVVPADDYDLYLRLTGRGGLLLVNQPLFSYRLHAGNASRDVRRLHRSERAVRRKHLTSEENTPEQMRLLRVGFRIREWEAYRSRMREAYDGLYHREIIGALRLFLYGQANLLRTLHGRP